MLDALFAMAVLVGSDIAAGPVTPAAQVAAPLSQNPKLDRFAGRPQARIAFAREVRNFQVKRDGLDDVLYLETRRDRWFRSEMNCFGIDDPRDAQGLLPLDRTFGFDRFSRVALVGFGHRRSECQLNGLVELTPDEAIELKLMRRRTGATPVPTPAS